MGVQPDLRLAVRSRSTTWSSPSSRLTMRESWGWLNPTGPAALERFVKATAFDRTESSQLSFSMTTSEVRTLNSELRVSAGELKSVGSPFPGSDPEVSLPSSAFGYVFYAY